MPLTRILTNLVADVTDVATVSRAAMRAYDSQYGSIESVFRRWRYGAFSHGTGGCLEEFWELTASQYTALHRAAVAEWGGTFRGMRRFAWTDPLAYLLGNAERRRLQLVARRARSAEDIVLRASLRSSS